MPDITYESLEAGKIPGDPFPTNAQILAVGLRLYLEVFDFHSGMERVSTSALQQLNGEEIPDWMRSGLLNGCSLRLEKVSAAREAFRSIFDR
jgi:hypothetical protein